jgi:hypothetical protein
MAAWERLISWGGGGGGGGVVGGGGGGGGTASPTFESLRTTKCDFSIAVVCIMVNLQLQLLKVAVHVVWIVYNVSEEGRQFPQNGGFWPSRERLMDHLHYRLNFDLDKNFITAWKSITKFVIFQSFVAKCCKIRKIKPCEICNFQSF